MHMVLPFVVALIYDKNKKILIGQHPDLKRKPYPLAWDLPGGKMEAGESPEACIKRELFEELNLKVTKAKLVSVFHHSEKEILPTCTNNIPSIGLCYKVVVKGRIVSTEQSNIHFASKKELRLLYDNMTPWSRFFLGLV